MRYYYIMNSQAKFIYFKKIYLNREEGNLQQNISRSQSLNPSKRENHDPF